MVVLEDLQQRVLLVKSSVNLNPGEQEGNVVEGLVGM